MTQTGTYYISIGPEPGGTLVINLTATGEKTFSLTGREISASGHWRHKGSGRLRMLTDLGVAQLALFLEFDESFTTFNGQWQLISADTPESGDLYGSSVAPVTDTFASQRFISGDYIDLSKITAISKFRSCEGHDYSDAFESDRSMKHYFDTTIASADGAEIPVFSPVDGTVIGSSQGWAGATIGIRPDAYPAFFIIIFHVELNAPLSIGQAVSSGEEIGLHIGSATMSDISIGLLTATGTQLVSYFDVMDDAIFNANYVPRGIAFRSEIIIPAADRDVSACIFGSYDPLDRITLTPLVA